MIVRLSRKALADLGSIGDYVALDNPRRAASYVRELRDKCRKIGGSPSLYPLLPRFEANERWRCLHSPYLIFYRIGPDEVIILRVLHAATDYESILFPN